MRSGKQNIVEGKAASLTSAETRNDEVIANMAIVLLYQEDVLLRKHIEKQIARFVSEGGFRESLTKARIEEKRKK